MLHVNNRFSNGDKVALAIDEDPIAGLVVGVTLLIDGTVRYMVSWGPNLISQHWTEELELLESVESNYDY